MRRQALSYLDGHEVEVVPKTSVPQASFVSIEYPAVLTDKPYPRDDDDYLHPSFSKALASLSPLPADYTSPDSALRHIGHVISQDKNRLLECKLAQACSSSPKQSTPAGEPSFGTQTATTNATFRHPILGDVVDTHNIVLRIRKRVWRKKRRLNGTGTADLQNGTTFSNTATNEDCHKEYTAEALGVTRHVVRFRTMADFTYDPGNMQSVEQTQRGEKSNPSFALHDALRQMNVEMLRNVKLDPEKEDYEIKVDGNDGVRISNLRMPPPILFSKNESSYSYGFRQNPSSRLRPVGEPDADGKQRMRYVNKLRLRDMAPTPFSVLASSSNRRVVPSQPVEAITARTIQRPVIMEKLQKLFEQRPMWSRRGLINQFRGEEKRLLQNQRQYIAAACYTINDGCWRDNLVRFSYDPRVSNESRIYQRLAFQVKQRPTKHTPRSLTREQQDGEDASSNEDETPGTAPNDDDRSHIFNGETQGQMGGNFLLIDIQDDIVRELIEDESEAALGTTLDRISGWYTPSHYAKIRAVMDHRMAVLTATGEPASRESCMAILAGKPAESLRDNSL